MFFIIKCCCKITSPFILLEIININTSEYFVVFHISFVSVTLKARFYFFYSLFYNSYVLPIEYYDLNLSNSSKNSYLYDSIYILFILYILYKK